MSRPSAQGLRKPQRLHRGRYVLDLLRELALRDLRVRYKRSHLGILWSLLTPLSQVLIFSFLFRTVMPLGVPSYTAFVFCGVLAWSWFSASLINAAGAVVAAPELIRRPGFPTSILPLLAVATNAIHFLIALPILLVLSPVDGGAIGASLLALPLVIAVQFVLTLGLAFPIAASNVRFRDAQHLVSLMTMGAFYLTPVFYSSEAVPERWRFLYELNPMAIVLTAYRDILIRNEWPNLLDLAAVMSFGVLVLLMGHGMFTRASSRFAEEL